MQIFIKNISNYQVKIITLKLGLQVGETRKLIADFEDEFINVKNELDILVANSEIIIVDIKGNIISTDDIFDDNGKSNDDIFDDNGKSNDDIDYDNNIDLDIKIYDDKNFYYVEDCFKVFNNNTVFKTFKGYAHMFKIITDNDTVRFRVKSEGVTMGWKYLSSKNEETIIFDYKLKDPIFEIISVGNSSTIKVYIDGISNGIGLNNLQEFIINWNEPQINANFDKWVGDTTWWQNNKKLLNVTNCIKYINSNAGYKNIIGIYEVDNYGKPINPKILVNNQHLLQMNTTLINLIPDNYNFFIISNGANYIAKSLENKITFDNSGKYPKILVNNVIVNCSVFFSDYRLNYDGVEHFLFESDGQGGTNIKIEDLPGAGDKDFNDVVLKATFKIEKIKYTQPTTTTKKSKYHFLRRH